MKPWKYAEEKAAKTFGAERNNIRTGNFGISAPDLINTGPFTIEVKHRKKLPKLVTNALLQARSYNKTKIPVAYLHEKGKRDAVILFYASDIQKWMSDIIKNYEYRNNA